MFGQAYSSEYEACSNKESSHIVKSQFEKRFLSFIDRLGKMVCLICSQVTVGEHSVNTSTWRENP